MNKVNKELLNTLIMWVNAFEDGDNGYKEYDNCLKTSLSAIANAQEFEKVISVKVPPIQKAMCCRECKSDDIEFQAWVNEHDIVTGSHPTAENGECYCNNCEEDSTFDMKEGE